MVAGNDFQGNPYCQFLMNENKNCRDKHLSDNRDFRVGQANQTQDFAQLAYFYS